MEDKLNILRQMRKHAQTFSSAVSSPLVVDEVSINKAVVLIDVVARDSRLRERRKISFKIPGLLKNLRLERNLNYLKTEVKKRIPETIAREGPLTEDQQNKEKEKFKRAEEKLRKVLDTKNC